MAALSTRQIFPKLETERLVLREIVPADVEAIFRIFSDEETMQYWSCRPFKSVDQARSLIEKITRQVQDGTGIHWAITLRGSGQLIGKCGFNEWRKVHRRGDISYIVAREMWGKGLVREALSAIIDYGFHRMNLHSIEAGVTPGNSTSVRILEKLGFSLEGRLRESFLVEDQFVDSLIYSLLRIDWVSPEKNL